MKKLLSAALALALLLGLIPVTASAGTTYSKELLQQMIVQTAFAYYYQSPYVQYDGKETTANGKLQRHNDKGAPEDAAVDSQVYSVCSNFCWKCYEDAFDFQLFGMTYSRTRTWAALETELSASEYSKVKDCVVYQYAGPYGVKQNLHGETDLSKALTESRKLLEPGDIIVYATKDAGHAMLFVGDYLGDGREWILHCWGASYGYEEQWLDYKEDEHKYGKALQLQTVDWACYNAKEKAEPNCYLGNPVHSDYGFAILRPFNDPAFKSKAPTAKALSRVQYPFMEIHRDLDRNKFQPAHTGEEIPVTVTIKNNGTAAYLELPVEEYVPEGQTLVEGSATAGATVTGTTIKWKVNVSAGKTAKLTYKVKLNAKQGETVTFPHGKVGEIPTRQTTLTMGGMDLSAAQKAKVKSSGLALNGKKTDAYQNLDFFNRFYDDALGVEIGLPATVEDLWNGICTAKNVAVSGIPTTFSFKKTADLTEEEERLQQMLLPLHFTGRYVYDSSVPDYIGIWDRVRDYNAVFYVPGDLFIGITGDAIKTKVKSPAALELGIYLGDSKLLYYDKDGKSTVKDFNKVMDYALKYNLLMVLRPSLVQCFDHSATDHVAAVSSTCQQTGVKEYWQCPACNALFSDSKGESPITDLSAWKAGEGLVQKSGHSLTQIPGKAPTCSSEGIADHWQCGVCKKNFADNTGTEEITDLAAWENQHKTGTKLPHELEKGVCKKCGFILLCEDPNITKDSDLRYAFVSAYNSGGGLLSVSEAEKDGDRLGIALADQLRSQAAYVMLFCMTEKLAPICSAIHVDIVPQSQSGENEMPIF